jgi:hypothetical protein
MADVPIGFRLSRNLPMPRYDTSYSDDADGRALATAHMQAVERYIAETNQTKNKK